jgi:hypothetical protein
MSTSNDGQSDEDDSNNDQETRYERTAQNRRVMRPKRMEKDEERDGRKRTRKESESRSPAVMTNN